MRMGRAALLAMVVLMMAPAQAQLPRAPSGGPTGNFLGPPSGNQADFLGVWNLRWVGPMGSNCPCSGSLTITTDQYGELVAEWKMNGPSAFLRGSTGYDQNVWTGRFAQADDVDFPLKGHFRLETRGHSTLTGSYQPDGTAVPFSWTGTR
jgi:hypothetical protein